MDSNDVRSRWAELSGEYSPEYYAYYGPDEASEWVLRALESFLDRDARVLELGCSSGRHLSHLREAGFRNLAGVEVNEDAVDVMAEHYSDLAADATVYLDAIEDVVEDFEDGQFDAVYSVETLQHVHPDADWVFEELARVAGDVLVTVENEGGDDDPDDRDVNYVTDGVPLYYRDWNRVFTQFGFEQVDAGATKRDTARAFRATDE